MTTSVSIWTEEELLEHIAVCKKAMKKAMMAKEYRLDKQETVRQDIQRYQRQLAYYKEELNKLNGTGGPVLQPGRPAR